MKTKLSVFTIVILAVMLIAFTESGNITGKVTDSTGQPLSGVAVKSKPASSVTYTDQNGIYKITVNKQTLSLMFSLPGYTLVTEKVGDRSVINVQLKAEILPAEDVTRIKADKRMETEAKSIGAAIAAPYAGMSYDSQKSLQRYNDDFNTEGYASVNENGFKNVINNPLSTFSIDVDNASYSNIRRFINMGQMPPADAVRIEEMINYFRYDYPEPHGEHPFSVYTEMAECPWNKKHQLLHVGLKGKSIDKSLLPPSNIVFLIDVSGSMSSPNKLPLLKSAFGLLVNELRAQDKVAIVVYAGAAGLVLESTPGNKKETLMAAIDNLEAGGSTAGGAGLILAYSEAQKNFIKGGNNRIILATDGDFNVGESSNGGMERLIEEKREQGVFITVLGFGMGNVKDCRQGEWQLFLYR
jgi:Ca-activated chloride channel family protein